MQKRQAPRAEQSARGFSAFFAKKAWQKNCKGKRKQIPHSPRKSFWRTFLQKGARTPAFFKKSQARRRRLFAQKLCVLFVSFLRK